MPPKKASTGAAKKATASHPSYADMIKEAVISLKERNGSSRQAIKKYVLANNSLGGTTDNAFTSQFNKALQKGSENGTFTRPKGASGPVKLAAPASKTAAAKPAATKTATKAPAAKKTATKTAGAKKAAPKKTAAAKKTTTKTAAKKTTATKTKANTGTKRKTPAAAPAVEDKAPVVLGKTKSGRVTKSKAPQPTKATAPKKKTAAAKKATPKKATPKKA